MYHEVVGEIKSLLEKHNCWFETFEHIDVRTSEEAAKTRPGYSLHQGAKALILKVENLQKEQKFVMLVIPGDVRFDNEKVKNLFNARSMRFATENEIADITRGVQIGGVPPFGNFFNLEVFVDPSVLENEKIIFNAGDRRVSVAMKSQDYKTIVEPKIVNLL